MGGYIRLIGAVINSNNAVGHDGVILLTAKLVGAHARLRSLSGLGVGLRLWGLCRLRPAGFRASGAMISGNRNTRSQLCQAAGQLRLKSHDKGVKRKNRTRRDLGL